MAIVPANAQARAKDALKIGQGLLVRGEMWLALGVITILVMLILPMPTWLLDFMLGVSIASSVLILMVTLFIQRPTDLSSFPTILLMTTLLRLALNMASTRLILSNGHQGTAAAGHVIETFGNLLMSGNFIIGVIVFIILLIVNFVVITKGSGRIAEVAARFTLDAMPGKQMAIDADLSSGLINETEAKARRKQLEDESTFYGAMDGAAKFVRGDAVAGLLITMINIIGGLLIGTLQHNLSFLQAANNYTLLTVGDGLVSQIPALIVSVAAGLLVTKGNAQGTTDKALVAQLGGFPAAMGMAAVLVAVLSLLPGMPTIGFLMIAAVMGAAAFYVTRGQQTAIIEAAEAAASGLPPGVAPGTPGAATPVADEPISTALQIDQIRLELGYGLLALINSPKGARLTDQIKALRRQVASEMGYIMPAVRIQDNLQLPANTYVVRIKEMEAGRGELRPNMLLVMDPRGEPISLAGEATTEPTFGLPAMWIAESNREEALFRGYTVVDPPTVITTHLTEVVKDNMPDLLSYAETQKLLNEIDKESQKLVADVIPGQVTINGLQRILQNLLAERVSIRDLPTILEAVAEAAAFTRNVSMMTEHVRTRLARQISENHSVGGVLPLVTLSPEWEQAFAEALVGQGEEKQLSMQPSQLQRFISSVRQTFDRFAVMGESPVLLVSPAIRPYVRSIIERFRPATTILSQSEIHPKAKIRTLGQI